MKAVIEVGANDGRDTERLYRQYGIDVFTFEPVPQLFKELTEKFSGNPKIHISNDAVSIKNGKGKFNITATHPKIRAKWGASSLYNFREGLKDKWDRADFEMVETVDVNLTRLDSFIARNSITEILFLHVDAQGEDLNVLRSLGEYVNIVKMGQIEVAHDINLYDNNENNYTDAIVWLKENDFILQEVKANDKLNAEMNIKFRRKSDQ